MKNYKKYLILGIIPFLAGCDFSKLDIFGWFKKDEPKGDLVIPTVNVDSLQINLPNKPTRSTAQSDIKTDGTYDYLNFYEVSDFHGAVSYKAEDTIGLSKMATYFETLRDLNKAGSIFLSSGDMYQGSAESNLTRGYLVNYCMNYMGFESMTIGNHEFDWGAEWIKKNSELAYNGQTIPFLGANIIDKTTNQIPTFLKASTTITRGNYKIGIVGTIGKACKSSILKTMVDNYDFLDEEEIVKKEAQALKSAGCDFVVWSSHNGVESIKNSGISKAANVDLAFGGHEHVSLPSEPENGTNETIPYAATKNYGKGIASIELKINKSTKTIESWKSEVIDTEYLTVDSNSNIDSILNQYDSELGKIKNIKLGSTPVDLENGANDQLKNVCMDTMQKAAKRFVKETQPEGINEEDLAVAYHNNGSKAFRASIYKGDITYGDVYQAFPFDNDIVLYKIKGLDLKSFACETETQGYAIWKSLKKDKSDIVNDKDYYIITTDFLALSKIGIPEENLIRTGLNTRDEIAKYIWDKDIINVEDYKNDSFKQFKCLIG